MIGNFLGRGREFGSLGTANPPGRKPSRFKADKLQKPFEHLKTPSGIVIATTIVTVSRVSPADQHRIGAPLKGPQYELGVDPAGTGHP